ncbi:MAG: hypothetical protein JNL98_41500 [Bryobacterales bacterium]|nr:hypothetical protein [Bryobacterales bacterium]
MGLRTLLFLTIASAALSAESRPAGITVSTWVREEIFAGFMTGDMPRFESGMAKLRDILAVEPNNPAALAWQGGGQVLRAVRAREAGDMQKYRDLYQEAQLQFTKALELAPNNISVLVVSGGTSIMFGDRLAEPDRQQAFELGYRNYFAASELQKQVMDKLPPHFRGELWSGLALAADRLDKRADREKYIALMKEQLQGTPYPSRAERWANQTRIEGSYMCLSCHEPGRLQARLKAVAEKK